MKVLCFLFVCVSILKAVCGVNDTFEFTSGQPIGGDRTGPVTYGHSSEGTHSTHDSFGVHREPTAEPEPEPEPEPTHAQDHSMSHSPTLGSPKSTMDRKNPSTDHSMHSTMDHDHLFADHNDTSMNHEEHMSSSSMGNKHLSSDPLNHDHSSMDEKNMTTPMPSTTERISRVPKPSKQDQRGGAVSLSALPALLTSMFISLRMISV